MTVLDGMGQGARDEAGKSGMVDEDIPERRWRS